MKTHTTQARHVLDYLDEATNPYYIHLGYLPTRAAHAWHDSAATDDRKAQGWIDPAARVDGFNVVLLLAVARHKYPDITWGTLAAELAAIPYVEMHDAHPNLGAPGISVPHGAAIAVGYGVPEEYIADCNRAGIGVREAAAAWFSGVPAEHAVLAAAASVDSQHVGTSTG